MEGPNKKKPRIRKTAPTVREKAELAKQAAQSQKVRRGRRIAEAAKRPLAKLRLPDNSVTRLLRKVGRGIKKVLSWLVPNYFVNSWRELRGVTWPTRSETWRLTLAVFIFALLFGIVVSIVDKGLDQLFKKFILE